MEPLDIGPGTIAFYTAVIWGLIYAGWPWAFWGYTSAAIYGSLIVAYIFKHRK